MMSQIDSSHLVTESPQSAFPPQLLMADGEELALCYSFSLFGLTLFGEREEAVAQLCQKLEECTQGRAKVQLFQTTDQERYSDEAKQVLALLHNHDYAIHVHGRYYGWLVTKDHPKLSHTLLMHLAHLCSMFFALYEASTFLYGQIHTSPDILKCTLTHRQRSIIALMAQGYDDQEIAQTLAIAYATVRKHREAIHRKLGVHTSCQAVQTAFLTGLYQPLANLAPLILRNRQE